MDKVPSPFCHVASVPEVSEMNPRSRLVLYSVLGGISNWESGTVGVVLGRAHPGGQGPQGLQTFRFSKLQKAPRR